MISPVNAPACFVTSRVRVRSRLNFSARRSLPFVRRETTWPGRRRFNAGASSWELSISWRSRGDRPRRLKMRAILSPRLILTSVQPVRCGAVSVTSSGGLCVIAGGRFALVCSAKGSAGGSRVAASCAVSGVMLMVRGVTAACVLSLSGSPGSKKTNPVVADSSRQDTSIARKAIRRRPRLIPVISGL